MVLSLAVPRGDAGQIDQRFQERGRENYSSDFGVRPQAESG